jgi:hypothetical protein
MAPGCCPLKVRATRGPTGAPSRPAISCTTAGLPLPMLCRSMRVRRRISGGTLRSVPIRQSSSTSFLSYRLAYLRMRGATAGRPDGFPEVPFANGLPRTLTGGGLLAAVAVGLSTFWVSLIEMLSLKRCCSLQARLHCTSVPLLGCALTCAIPVRIGLCMHKWGSEGCAVRPLYKGAQAQPPDAAQPAPVHWTQTSMFSKSMENPLPGLSGSSTTMRVGRSCRVVVSPAPMMVGNFRRRVKSESGSPPFPGKSSGV